MAQEADPQQALDMLNNALREMKGELNQVDEMPLSKKHKDKAHHMHEIYDELSGLIDTYSQSHSHEDLNYAFRQLEILQPAFILNYNEIVG